MCAPSKELPERGTRVDSPPPCARARRRQRIRRLRIFHQCDLRGREQGSAAVGLTRVGKGTRIVAIEDSAGLPLSVRVARANLAVVSLVDATLAIRFLRRLFTRLIGNEGGDCDTLHAQLAARSIECIALNRSTRRYDKHDGRQLRRYCRRWRIERLVAWLQNFRGR